MVRRIYRYSLWVALLLLTSCGGGIDSHVYKDLKSEDANKRAGAVTRLAGMTDKRDTVVPLLLKAVDDESAEVAEAAVGALAAFPDPSEKCVETLAAAAATGSTWRLRQTALETLAGVAPAHEKSLEAMKTCLEDADLLVAIKAANKLMAAGATADAAAEIGAVVKRAVEERVKAGGAGPFNAGDILLGLAEQGSEAAGAVDALQQAQQVPNISRRLKSAIAAVIQVVAGQGSVDQVHAQLNSLAESM